MITTGLVSLFEKMRLKSFLQWVLDVDPDKPSTWTTVYPPPKSVKKDSIDVAFSHFGVNETTKVS